MMSSLMSLTLPHAEPLCWSRQEGDSPADTSDLFVIIQYGLFYRKVYHTLRNYPSHFQYQIWDLFPSFVVVLPIAVWSHRCFPILGYLPFSLAFIWFQYIHLNFYFQYSFSFLWWFYLAIHSDCRQMKLLNLVSRSFPFLKFYRSNCRGRQSYLNFYLWLPETISVRS